MNKKMSKSEIVANIKKYNKVGYYVKECGSWNFVYKPIAVIGETEKSWRCVIVGEDEVSRTITESYPDGRGGSAGHAIFKANVEKMRDNPRFITIRKASRIHEERYESWDNFR